MFATFSSARMTCVPEICLLDVHILNVSVLEQILDVGWESVPPMLSGGIQTVMKAMVRRLPILFSYLEIVMPFVCFAMCNQNFILMSLLEVSGLIISRGAILVWVPEHQDHCVTSHCVV